MKKGSLCQLCQCHIRDNTIFSDLTQKQLEYFKDVVKTSFHKKKGVIFMEGDPCYGFYVLKSGRVKLLRISRDGKEQIIKILQPGELLGMEIFYEGKQHSNTAMAMDDCELCFIGKENFFRILDKESSITKKVIIALSRELNRAYGKIGRMGLMNARAKMAHLLSTLASEYGISEDGRIRLNLTLSRMEIAELLGITQETSIRLLKTFKDEGFIEIRRKEIIINSIDKLHKVCE